MVKTKKICTAISYMHAIKVSAFSAPTLLVGH